VSKGEPGGSDLATAYISVDPIVLNGKKSSDKLKPAFGFMSEHPEKADFPRSEFLSSEELTLSRT